MVEADRYLIETESAVRHDAELEIRAGRARTAVWSMERIVKKDTKLADNYYVLGEAYRGLGARTPEPTAHELTDEGKSQTKKMMSKMTSQEYEAALLKAPGGQQAWDSNRGLAEKNYKRAIEISPDEPEPHRGLGFLYELEHDPELSVQEFRSYLELAPSAVDAPQIRRHIAAMEKESTKPSQPPASK
jgi:tetratricopeptide (TPR) repeat protein